MYSPPSFPPLYFVKRRNVTNIETFTPPLSVAERGKEGEFMIMLDNGFKNSQRTTEKY